MCVVCAEYLYTKASIIKPIPWGWGVDYLGTNPLVVQFKVFEDNIYKTYPWDDKHNGVKWVESHPKYIHNLCYLELK